MGPLVEESAAMGSAKTSSESTDRFPPLGAKASACSQRPGA